MKQIFLVISILCVAGLAPIASSQADQEKTNLEQNKAIVRGYMNEVINKGNLNSFDIYFSERVLFNNSEGLKQGLTSMLRSMRGAFPDFHLTIEDQIAEGNKVITRVTFRGTHQGDYRGIAPTGKQIKYSGIAIDRIVDGKVVEMWHVADTCGMLQQIGMEVMAGFIVGFDNDPDDIFERQIEFIRESAIPLAMVGLLTALPDTQLWRRLDREGRLLVESTGNNTDGSLNFVPKMDATRLIEGYKSLMRTIYSPGEYYQRALNCLERVVAGAPEARRNRVASDVMALFRIVLALGVRDRARGEFWRYLRRALTRHREKFTEAVRLAAVGYHFRKLTED
jgi:predicted ester cyclase